MRFSVLSAFHRPRFKLLIVLCLCRFTICSAQAQSLKVLHKFSGGDGEFPYYAPLVFDKAGNLYGTTYYGGDVNSGCGYGCGTVFEMSPKKNGGWSETVLHTFAKNSGDGTLPAAGLTFDAAGNLYGTTSEGGTHNEGTVFELVRQKDGTFAEKILYNFCSVGMYCSDGNVPTGVKTTGVEQGIRVGGLLSPYFPIGVHEGSLSENKFCIRSGFENASIVHPSGGTNCELLPEG